MSIDYHYEMSSDINISSGGYGTKLKTLVSKLLEMDTNLTIDRVLNDTTSTYDVRLRIMGSDNAIEINNSSSYIYTYFCYYSNDTWIKSNYYTQSDRYLMDGYIFKVCHYRIGNCLSSFYFTSNYSSYGYKIGNSYGYFRDSLNDDIIIWNPSYYHYNSNWVLYNTKTNLFESLGTTSKDDYSTLRLSEFNYILFPYLYQIKSDSRVFYNIRWGGSHKLYRLYNKDGPVSLQIGERVTINGNSIISNGYIIYAE